jgi:MinD-like ATPase involved in chromosome partitioning or flagellar assembly
MYSQPARLPQPDPPQAVPAQAPQAAEGSPEQGPPAQVFPAQSSPPVPPPAEPAVGAPPLSAPPVETPPVVTYENGRHPAQSPQQPWTPQPGAGPGDNGPGGAAGQPEYPDLAHPDLDFSNLAHPSLGLSPAPPQLDVQPDPSFQDAWGQAGAQQPQQWTADPQGRPGPGQQWGNQTPQASAAPPVAALPEHGAAPAAGPGAFADELLRNKRHGDPLMRRVGRGIGKAVGATAAHDAREQADLASRIRQPVPTCRRIAVTSIRGGAGKTTVAGLTATVITQVRQDRVLATDADSGLGSLPLRMGVQTELSLQDLARAHPRSWEEATRFLAQSADGLWVLSNTTRGRIGAELEIDTFRSATGEMSRYFSAMVIDCGAGLLPELQRGILTEAHAQILVTPATVDGALSARGALDWMAGNGYGALLPRTIVTLVTHTPHEDADLERAKHLLSAGGMTVVHVPYDRHLAGGTPIELPLTGEAAQNAATRIAAEIFSRAASV